MLRTSLHAANSDDNGGDDGDDDDDDDKDDDEVSYLIDCRRIWGAFWLDGSRSVIVAVCLMIHSSR